MGRNRQRGGWRSLTRLSASLGINAERESSVVAAPSPGDRRDAAPPALLSRENNGRGKTTPSLSSRRAREAYASRRPPSSASVAPVAKSVPSQKKITARATSSGEPIFLTRVRPTSRATSSL